MNLLETSARSVPKPYLAYYTHVEYIPFGTLPLRTTPPNGTPIAHDSNPTGHKILAGQKHLHKN